MHAGGIERYLEEFPQGGHFRGKNFVFDERVRMHAGPHLGAHARLHQPVTKRSLARHPVLRTHEHSG